VSVVLGEVAPIPVYQRGIFFTETAEVELVDLILNTSFTLEFIIRPETSGNLLTILNEDSSTFMEYSLTEDSTSLLITNEEEVVGGSWTAKTWTNVVVIVQHQVVNLYVDNIYVGIGSTLTSLVIDYPNHAHFIGR